jgi:aryl carrier-like protein
LRGRERVTLLNTVPSVATELARTQGLPASVCTVNLAGEPLQGTLVRDLYQQRSIRRVLNLYGPSEDTTYSTFTVVAPEERVPSIGRPIARTQVYLLDAYLQLVPPGSIGELYLGGSGLARGYIGRPDLTAERFVPHPFSTEPGARLYRTGDLGRYRVDGAIEYLGRRDFQVKLRGFRIELGEIEARLREQVDVQDALVVVQKIAADEGAERGYLVAYLVPAADANIQVQAIETELGRHLPAYMVPHTYMLLDALPVTPNGKVDRQALPRPEQSLARQQAVATPRTPAEQALQQIWQTILGIDQIGIHDNFFALGGDSIISLQVVARARQLGLHLTPKQLFQYQTIAQLAAVVVDAPGQVGMMANTPAVAGPMPLTPIQHWFFARNLAQAHHFNQAVFLQIPAHWSFSLLRRALTLVERQHAVLRSHFVSTADGWLQQVRAGEDVFITQVDLRTVPTSMQSQVMEQVVNQTQASLNLERGPLFRAVSIVLGDHVPSRLLLVIHHLVVDGVSWRILLEDVRMAMQALLRQQPVLLPPVTSTFAQWSQHLQQQARAQWLRDEIPYWLRSAQVLTSPLPFDGAVDQQQRLQPEATTHYSKTLLSVQLTR